jgi:hypothetical protein
MRFNFRTASCSSDERDRKLAAMNEDLLGILDEYGVGGLQARPEFEYKLATLFRETVVDQFSMTDPTPIFTERRTARLGDTWEFTRLVNTARAVRYTPNSHPLIFTPRKAKYPITTAGYELPVGIDLIKVLTRQFTVGDVSNMMGEAVTRHYVDLVLTAVDTACGPAATDIRGRALRSTVGGPDVTQAALDTQIRRMASYNTGLTIFGHRYALEPIFDFAVDTDSSRDELRQRGEIGVYRGARIVSVQDDYNDYQAAFTSINGVDWEKLVFLGSSQVGAVLLERDLSPLNWQETDPEKSWFRTGIRWDHGILVWAPWRYGVIQMA